MKEIIAIIIIIQSFLSYGQGNISDSYGRKQGHWRKIDEKTNKLIYEGDFKDDKPVGIFKYYYPNDSVRAVMKFKNEGKVAYAKLFHMNGKRMAEGKYLGKETKDSLWLYYDEAGVLISKENYKEGKKHGKAYVYLPDGGLSEERTYKMDVQDGPFKDYFDGKHVKSQGNYVNGKMEGKVVYFYPNGVEVAAGFYKNGLKNGPWIYKTESGKVREKELYKNGTLASKKETDEFFAKSKTGGDPNKTVSTKQQSR
jgi:antitoxin component YwqK of YwqJK toxin-antitoxin module